MPSEIKKLLRPGKLPHIWCPGCGHGIILQAFLKAVLTLELDQEKLVVVSGIGCSSRSVGYVNFDSLHSAHGRAIPFATGIKLANPELTAVVLAGDGDISAIGGNHFIHAARRNIDITVVVFNNLNYGMTGGQYSPLTRVSDLSVTSPYGNIEPPFDLCMLAKAAGATYVARSTTYHTPQLPKLIGDGIKHHGFSVIEILTGCPTYYGRINNLSAPMDMLNWQRDHAANLKQYESLSEAEKKDKFSIGLLYSAERAEYGDEYLKIIQKAKGASTRHA